MKSLLNRKWMLFMCLCMWVLVVRTLSGCSMSKDDGNKVRDMEFSVTAEADIPEELKQIIAEKQKTPFKLTVCDAPNLCRVVGYGKQDTGGYSIAVNELYLTENSIVLDTDLLGPEKGESGGTEPSFPFIVIRTELSELPVVFQETVQKKRNRACLVREGVKQSKDCSAPFCCDGSRHPVS